MMRRAAVATSMCLAACAFTAPAPSGGQNVGDFFGAATVAVTGLADAQGSAERTRTQESRRVESAVGRS